MRRAFVSENDASAAVAFPFGFAPHQHLNPPGQNVDFGLLGGDDIAQFIDRPDQVGDFFFQMLHVRRSLG
jgi:hypothetical protein